MPIALPIIKPIYKRYENHIIYSPFHRGCGGYVTSEGLIMGSFNCCEQIGYLKICISCIWVLKWVGAKRALEGGWSHSKHFWQLKMTLEILITNQMSPYWGFFVNPFHMKLPEKKTVHWNHSTFYLGCAIALFLTISDWKSLSSHPFFGLK